MGPSRSGSGRTEGRAVGWFGSLAFANNPFEDRLAAALVVGGWGLIAAGIWLLGRSGLGFERRPELGAYGWLIVGLLLLAGAYAARWATRRVIEQGGNAAFLWLRVRRTPDDGRGDAPVNRPDDMPIIVLSFGSAAGGVVLANLAAYGYLLDTSPIPWVIAAAMWAGAAVWGVWVHHRVLACPTTTHGIEYIGDGHAKAATWVAGCCAANAAWIAGVAGIPATVGGGVGLAGAVLSLTALLLSAVCMQASVARTRRIAVSVCK